MKVNLSLLSCFSTGNSNVEQNLTFLIQSSKVFLGIVVIAKPIKKQLLLLSFDKKKVFGKWNEYANGHWILKVIIIHC